MSNSLNNLLPLVKQKAEQFITKCKSQGIDVVVTSTLRTMAEQDALYAEGRTTPGQIVTKAKAGQSYHNWGVAFDVVPTDGVHQMWDNDALWSKLGQLGVSCGLEWGGSWVGFQDKPHFQYTLGYTWQDFIDKKVDLTKFNIKTMEDNNVGNATVYEVFNKETKEVLPVFKYAADHNQDFLVHTEDGTEIRFVYPDHTNETYELREIVK